MSTPASYILNYWALKLLTLMLSSIIGFSKSKPLNNVTNSELNANTIANSLVMHETSRSQFTQVIYVTSDLILKSPLTCASATILTTDRLLCYFCFSIKYLSIHWSTMPFISYLKCWVNKDIEISINLQVLRLGRD